MNPQETSAVSNSPAGARCRPKRESPTAQRRPVPGQGGVRSSPPAPALTFPLRSPHPDAPPPTLCLPPRPCQTRAAGGKRAPGSKRDGSQGVSPQSPCHPAGPAAGARDAPDSATGARCRCGGSCCSCGCGGAGGSGRAAPGAGKRGAAAGAARSHSSHAAAAAAARVSRQHSRAAPGSRAKARKKARLTGGARRARSGTGARRLCSSLAFPGAPGSAAGAAHELPT